MRPASGKATRRRHLLGITLAALVLVLAMSMALSEITNAIVSGDMSSEGTDLASTEIADESNTETTYEQVTEEPSRYSFASSQGDSNLQVVPGGEIESRILFYNVDGNRITHITLRVVDAPEDWEVDIDPPLHEQNYEVGGQIINVEENLHSEPTELTFEEIADIPHGTACLTLSDRGYALARVITVTIRAPESAETGTSSDIKIAAAASWLGQNGTATVKQTRDFDFRVTVLPAVV